MEIITQFAIFIACFISYVFTVQTLRSVKPSRANSHRMIGFSIMVAVGSFAAYFITGWQDLANEYVIGIALMLALANMEHIIDMKKQEIANLVAQHKDVA